MTIENDVQKAKQAERKAINALNAEQGWVSRHPGWTSLFIAGLLALLIVVVVKSCH